METNLISKIEFEYNSLSKTHRIIADLFLDNLVTQETTLIEVAKMGYCSHSTVLRFIRIMGYKNFKVFMDDFFNSNLKVKNSLSKSFEIVDLFLENQCHSIENFVEIMIEAENIYILASGMSYLPAYNLYYKGNMISNKFQLYKELPDNITINTSDLVIFVSNSGNSRKLRVLSNSINQFYLITNHSESSLAKIASNTFSLENHYETSHELDTQPRESIYSMVYFTDCLFTLLKNKQKN